MDNPHALAFMGNLAMLVSPAKPEETAQSLKAMCRMLGDIPERAWRSRSALDAVATSERRSTVPTYGDIRRALVQWVRDNPDKLALPAPEGKAPLSSEALAYCRTFAQRWRDGADKKLITSIAKQHYPREAWLAIKAEYGLE